VGRSFSVPSELEGMADCRLLFSDDEFEANGGETPLGPTLSDWLLSSGRVFLRIPIMITEIVLTREFGLDSDAEDDDEVEGSASAIFIERNR